MDSSIISAFVTAGIALVGVIISNRATFSRMQADNEKRQAITETKLDELTREVREHNNFARRVPVVEEQIKVINHRLSGIEETEKVKG